MTRLLPLLSVLALLTGCGKQPVVKSGVDLEQLTKGKSKVPADSHESLPSTYFELTAWIGDSSKNPPTSPSATGTVASASQIACVSATEKNGSENTGRCEVTIPAGTYKLKSRETVTSNGGGEVRLSCSGDAPALCKALVVN
jgi:hypothetical protein